MPQLPSKILVHRARILRRESLGGSVEGTKLRGTTTGPWIKCRLFPDETPQQDGFRGGRRVLMRTPHVIVGTHDENGLPVEVGDIGPNVQLEIDGGVLGQEVWHVQSDPQPLLAPTVPIGFYFAVSRADAAGARTG